MQNPLLLVDTWESGGALDFDILLQNGINGVIIRLNDMNGGHHMDANFLLQWQKALRMIRIPYFVYNPWVSGVKNYEWLLANMPLDAASVMLDIEVVYSGYPTTSYAAEVAQFVSLVKNRWNTMVYTGQWFLPNLSTWPKDVKYWWAQYPYTFYPPSVETWTWDELRNALLPYVSPGNAQNCPGPIGMWQFTADRIVLPGCTKPMDVNVFFGTQDELSMFAYGLSPDIVTEPQVGVMMHRIERFGSPLTVHVLDPYLVDIWVSGREDDFQQVYQTIVKNNANGGTNGGGWPYGSTQANEIWKSNGVLLQYEAKDDRPWVGWTIDNRVVFGRGVPSPDVRDAVGYDRYLIENGVINPRYSDMSVYANTVKDARTFSGRTWDGKFVLCVAEGDDRKNYGLTFHEEAVVLQEFGCYTGGNHDGGSSSTCINTAVSSESLNLPSDGQQAFVINAILFRAVETPPPSGETVNYIVTNSVTPRKTPSMYETVTKAPLPVGYSFTSNAVQVVPQKINSVDYMITFIQLPDMYWVPGYLPYKDTTYVKEDSSAPVPPATWPEYFILEDPDGNRQRYNIETNPA